MGYKVIPQGVDANKIRSVTREDIGEAQAETMLEILKIRAEQGLSVADFEGGQTDVYDRNSGFDGTISGGYVIGSNYADSTGSSLTTVDNIVGGENRSFSSLDGNITPTEDFYLRSITIYNNDGGDVTVKVTDLSTSTVIYNETKNQSSGQFTFNFNESEFSEIMKAGTDYNLEVSGNGIAEGSGSGNGSYDGFSWNNSPYKLGLKTVVHGKSSSNVFSFSNNVSQSTNNIYIYAETDVKGVFENVTVVYNDSSTEKINLLEKSEIDLSNVDRFEFNYSNSVPDHILKGYTLLYWS